MLTVPACPHRTEMLARLEQALAMTGTDAEIQERIVADAAEAAETGMHGSPTILIDGRDPFAIEPVEASLSCRLYHSEAGMEGAPSMEALIRAFS